MNYRSIRIRLGERDFKINLGHRMSQDLAMGIVAGMHLVMSIMTNIDTIMFTKLNSAVELITLEGEDTLVKLDGEIPEILEKYVNIKGEDITPAKTKGVDEMKFIYWVLADVSKSIFIMFQFETSDFIRGVLAIFESFKINVRDIMFSVPYFKAINWKNISLTIKNSERDLLDSPNMKNIIPYIPKSKYNDYCNERDNQIELALRDVNINQIDLNRTRQM